MIVSNSYSVTGKVDADVYINIPLNQINVNKAPIIKVQPLGNANDSAWIQYRFLSKTASYILGSLSVSNPGIYDLADYGWFTRAFTRELVLLIRLNSGPETCDYDITVSYEVNNV